MNHWQYAAAAAAADVDESCYNEPLSILTAKDIVRMHTLFSPTITASLPIPEPPPAPPVYELSFASSLYKTSTNSTSSSFSRSPCFGSLMYRQDNDQIRHDVKRATPHRRKVTPKLLMMGQRRSGKSSIRSVVFEKMAPAETLYLESTHTVKETTMQSFTNFEVIEVPSHITVDALENEHKALFHSLGAVIWVIDVQDEYLSSIAALVKTAMFLDTHHPRVHLEVLIHKTDGLTDEYRYDASREVRQRVQDEISDAGLGAFHIGFHQTSIFDHSIFEATSKIVQKLLLQLDALESMLNRLCSTCGMQKAFLFDTTTKLFIATDASPTFLADYEACSDYLDVLVDLKALYSWHKRPNAGSDSAESLALDENLGESMVSFETSGETYIYAKEMTEHLTLICILGKGSGVEKRILIDYNVAVLQDAVIEVFDATR